METVDAILIDPNARTVSSVRFDGSLERFKELTGSDSMTTAPFMNASPGGYLDDEGYWVEGTSIVPEVDYSDTFLLDDDAMMADNCAYFASPFHMEPGAGKALVVGTDVQGRNCSPQVTVEQLQKHIAFFDDARVALAHLRAYRG